MWRALAFALLNVLLGEDHNNKRLAYLSQKGFIRHCLDAFNQENDMTALLISTEDAALREAIVLDSKLSMLVRIAQTQVGAQVLIENGIFHCLTECQWINHRPDYEALNDENGWGPGFAERYQNSLDAILRIVVSLLVSLPQNIAVAGNVLDFVLAHSDLLLAILKDNSLENPAVLNEIRLATEIFYHLVANAQALLVQKLTSNAMRFHHTLLNLFTALSRREMKMTPSAFAYQVDEPNSTTASFWHEINRNVLAYCQVLCDASASDAAQGLPSIIFAPSLATDTRENVITPGLATRAKPPPLLLLLQYLNHVLEQHDEANEDYKHALDMHQRGMALTAEEVTETLTAAGDMVDEMSPQQRLVLAQHRLAETIFSKRKEISTLLYMLENQLILIWRHLLHYTSQNSPSLSLNLSSKSSAISRKDSGSLTLSRAEVNEFKRKANSLIGNTLNRLQDFEAKDNTKGTFYYLIAKKIKEAIRIEV
jgi:nuclear pore complex protein Nup205